MNNWSRKTLKESSVNIIDGDRGVNYPKKSEFYSKGYCLFLNTGNVTKTGFDFDNKFFITDEKDKLLRKGKLVRGDIVLTTRGTVGNVGYFNDKIEYSNIRINSGMVILRVDENKISPYYLYLFLRSELFKNQVLKQGSGSAQPQLPIQNLNNIVFPWFPLETQKQIAKVLSDLDAKIEVNNNINQELEAMAKTLYDYWFVQFEFPTSEAQAKRIGNLSLVGKPYKSSGGKMVFNEALKREIPEGWENGTFETISTIIGGSTPSKAVSENFTTNKHMSWITPKDLSFNKGKKFITRGELDVTELGIKSASLKIMPKGTVLLSSRAPIGYLAISREEVTTNQGFKSFVPKEDYSAEFIYYCIYNQIPKIEAYSSGSTFKEVSASTLKTINISIPNKEVLEGYYKISKPIFKKQNLLESENQKFSELRDWLLPMLMNGQVTVASLRGTKQSHEENANDVLGMVAEDGETYKN